jgi:hypothetical protein
MRRFAFISQDGAWHPYIRAINGSLLREKAAPCETQDFAWRNVMKIFGRLLWKPRNSNLTTLRERQRLAQTMPGQTGAVVASRHGLFV